MRYPELYPHSFEMAEQNGELPVYRESNRLNRECAKEIYDAIRSHYSNNRLDPACVDVVLGEYGAERVQWVLAHTLQMQDHDGRYSHNNKEWAKAFNIPEVGLFHYAVEAHPGLLDLFVTRLRKNILANELEPAPPDSTPGEYKYYSVRRPVDIGTIPREPKPEKVLNFDWRMPVENGAFEAWGSVTYKQPLPDAQVQEYELRAASSNPREKPSVIDALKDTSPVPPQPEQSKQAGKDKGPEL